MTFTSVAPATTWALVAIRPSASTTNPVPAPSTVVVWKMSRGSMTVVRIDTTPSRTSATRLLTSVTSPLTLSSWTVSPPSGLGKGGRDGGAARRRSVVVAGVDDCHGAPRPRPSGEYAGERTTGLGDGAWEVAAGRRSPAVCRAGTTGGASGAGLFGAVRGESGHGVDGMDRRDNGGFVLGDRRVRIPAVARGWSNGGTRS